MIKAVPGREPRPRWGEPDHHPRGLAPDAPVSVQALLQAAGGGEIPPAGLDTNNDYSVVANGGEFTDPAYVIPGG
jgi:hypothetical protein